MANEGCGTVSITVDGENIHVNLSHISFLFDVSGTDYILASQKVGAAEEALELGDVTIGGYGVFIVPLSDDGAIQTGTVSIRADSGETDLVDLEPGDGACFRLSTQSIPYVIASVANTKLEYLVVDA